MKKILCFVLAVLIVFSFASCSRPSENESNSAADRTATGIPSAADFSGQPYTAVNNNNPFFSESDLSDKSFENYSEQDALGRCQVATANIGTDLMPTEERGEIGQIKPTGWHTVKYDFVDGKYLYNRCHLIGFQLTGENANDRNLITGTRYLNVQGMLPFENMVADYIKETGNHVMYRVTPVFTGENLLAEGVLMEGLSVEDGGDGIKFCVFCFNVQPGVAIDYATGESTEDGSEIQTAGSETYVLNTSSKKFHRPDCSSVGKIKDKNRQAYKGSRDILIKQGYEPCGTCKP